MALNTNPHTEFGVPMTFGLEFRLGAFLPSCVKCIGQLPHVEEG